MNAPHPDRDVETAEKVLTSFRSTTNDQDGCRRGTTIASHREAAGISDKNKRRDTGSLGVADWLALAAAPTFAIMALLVARSSEASPLGGMVLMYVLMAVFESVAWLKLISSRRSSSRREQPR